MSCISYSSSSSFYLYFLVLSFPFSSLPSSFFPRLSLIIVLSSVCFLLLLLLLILLHINSIRSFMEIEPLLSIHTQQSSSININLRWLFGNVNGHQNTTSQTVEQIRITHEKVVSAYGKKKYINAFVWAISKHCLGI